MELYTQDRRTEEYSKLNEEVHKAHPTRLIVEMIKSRNVSRMEYAVDMVGGVQNVDWKSLEKEHTEPTVDGRIILKGIFESREIFSHSAGITKPMMLEKNRFRSYVFHKFHKLYSL
jgi:hypothetical protein